MGKTVWQWLSKFHSACPEESFEHFSLKKLWFWNEFRTLSEKIPDFAKKVRQGLRNFNLRVRRKTVREKNLKKWWFLSIFVLWVKKIGLWAKQLGRCCQNYIRRVWGFFNQKRMIFHIFLHCEQNHCLLLPNNYGRISKTSIYVSGKNFWEKKNWEKDDFLVILYFELKKWTLGKTVWQGLSKFHSACPEENFQLFPLEKRWYLNDFRTLSEKVPEFAENLQQPGFPKFQSTCPVKNFERKKMKKKDDFLVILYSDLKEN